MFRHPFCCVGWVFVNGAIMPNSLCGHHRDGSSASCSRDVTLVSQPLSYRILYQNSRGAKPVLRCAMRKRLHVIWQKPRITGLHTLSTDLNEHNSDPSQKAGKGGCPAHGAPILQRKREAPFPHRDGRTPRRASNATTTPIRHLARHRGRYGNSSPKAQVVIPSSREQESSIDSRVLANWSAFHLGPFSPPLHSFGVRKVSLDRGVSGMYLDRVPRAYMETPVPFYLARFLSASKLALLRLLQPLFSDICAIVSLKSNKLASFGMHNTLAH